MGQTRVDLRHLLEDLRDAYPGEIEETILSEVVANALDSGASSIRVLADPGERTIVVVDDGTGMGRRQLARYHDLATTSKARGEGIGFAGVGIKLGLLVAEAVLTETRRGTTHVATRWHLASRHKAPWQWVSPPGWVGERGTAVGLHLKNPLTPLLDPGYIEVTLRLHYQPLFDAAFEKMLAAHYPRGITFAVNGRVVEGPASSRVDARATLAVKLPRKRKPVASGFLERSDVPLPEDRRGIAVSTLGKVIKHGWDWVGLSPASPELLSGLIEAPGLAAALTLNKADFIRAGRRGVDYLAYRKAIQEAVQAQLTTWGEDRSREEKARRRAARPIERDLEAVLLDLAEEFPALAALVERRAGGQRRLPTGADARSAGGVLAAGARGAEEQARAAEAPGGLPEESGTVTPSDRGTSAGAGGGEGAGDADRPTPEREKETEGAAGTLPPVGGAAGGRRRPTRYGLGIDFAERPDWTDIGRLVESTVIVNTAHPAYRRAVASRSEGYHMALCVGMALAAVAVEPAEAQGFLTAFLARWGEALGRDRRRRTGRPRSGRGS
jgi:anti-sigma regulatory factor (Ser/Thr protein kinase)